jgi:tripartite-type tricarboxylate transporter receptor subunit TctC
MAGIQMTHAPYRGATPAFIDLIPGRVHCYFGSGELLTYLKTVFPLGRDADFL